MSKIVNILDLSDMMTPELEEFLSGFNLNFVTESESFTHILISNSTVLDGNHFDKKLIALEKPKNYQDFYRQGGSFFLNPEWLKTIAGKHILTRYFHSEAGSLFTENYSNYKRSGSFNITNILSTGEFIDMLVFSAASAQASAFDIKTGFSHLLVYLSRLNNQSITGLPFEVSYGNCKKDFVIQVHMNANGLTVESIADALEEKYERHSKLSGLFFAFKSCDLMELSFIENVNKLTISMHWLDSVFVDEPGFILNMATNPVETKVERYFLESDSLPDDDFARIEGVTQVFKDESILINDHEAMDKFVMNIKGHFEDLVDKSKMIVKGTKLDVDHVIFNIAGSIDEVVKSSNMQVRSLAKDIEEVLHSELEAFSNEINVPIEDLSEDELGRFQVERMSEIIKRELLKPIPTDDAHEVVFLKKTVESLLSKIQVLKESNVIAEEIRMKAMPHIDNIKNEELDVFLEVKKNTNVSDFDMEMMKKSLEKEFGLKSRIARVEALRNESLLLREIEKTKQQLHIKDLIEKNAKTALINTLKQKDEQISLLNEKNKELKVAASLDTVSALTSRLNNTEKLNQTLSKQVEIYKNQIAELAANRNNANYEEEQREKNRQLKVINEGMKSMLRSTKEELEQLKVQAFMSRPASGTREETGNNKNLEEELKRLQHLNKQLELQVMDSVQKAVMLESKLFEGSPNALRAPVDDASRIRIGQLESSVKKLTQDMIANRNQLNDSKKEINRLRSEKTFIQNQLDKAKKDADKAKKQPGKKAA